MKRLKVCVVTGTRAEFGIWKSVLRAIEKSPRLDLKLIVTGTHLLKSFGETVRDIELERFRITARVPMYKDGEPSAASLSRGIEGLAQSYRRAKADIVLVLGDRLEMLAAASAALSERIPIAHVHGGETAPGIWDEQIRHAITKMAHVHFCATKVAGRRIEKMGEPSKRVHFVGAPALETVLWFQQHLFSVLRTLTKEEQDAVMQTYEAPAPLIVLHPGSADERLEYRHARHLVLALIRAFPLRKLPVIGPNNDPGHRGILRAYREFADRIVFYPSMPQATFWAMMIASKVLVGNSSSGIIEAATLGVPVINIGDRQAGRERNENVIDVSWESGAAGIAGALRTARNRAFLTRVALRRNIYGKGDASQRIIKVLKKIAQDGGLELTKQFQDRS